MWKRSLLPCLLLSVIVPLPVTACERCAKEFERVLRAAIAAKENNDVGASLPAVMNLVSMLKTVPEHIWKKIAKDFGSEENYFRALSTVAEPRHREAFTKTQSLFAHAVHK